uniref:Uncharacterized protein n=1 Tax=Oryza meridionalis TaxID=40149 RepID=A0A0E0DNN1_9ORYZ
MKDELDWSMSLLVCKGDTMWAPIPYHIKSIKEEVEVGEEVQVEENAEVWSEVPDEKDVDVGKDLSDDGLDVTQMENKMVDEPDDRQMTFDSWG